MSERMTGDPGHNGDPSNQATDPSALAPEAVALIGEDAIQYMDRATGALDELGRIAEAEDPFANDGRGCQVDLGFLNDEQAQVVLNFRTANRPFRGMPIATISRFASKIVKKLPGIHRDVRQKIDDAEPALHEVQEAMGEVADHAVETEEISLLGSLRQFDGDLKKARDMLPSPTTVIVADNMYSACINARNTVDSLAGQRRIIRLRIGVPKTMIDLDKELRGEREDFKKTARLAASMRNYGTANFEFLQQLVGAERIKEALGMIVVADRIRERLAAAKDHEEYDPEGMEAAEHYVAEHAVLAETVLGETHPEILKNDRLRAMVAGLHPAAIEEGSPERPERQVTVGNDVLGKLTEAKNVLRGGRRLKPESDGQTEADIKRMADGLHSLKDKRDNPLLEPEESGIVVAMATGKFEGFAHVCEAVKRHAAENGLNAFPAERAGVVRELDRLDITAALAKIGAILDNPDFRLHMDRVLGTGKAREIQAIVEQTLVPDESNEADEEAA